MPDLVPAAIPAGRLCSLPQPTLQAGQLTLRPWRLSDAEAVVEAYRDPDIRHWHVQSMTEDEALAWLASWPDRWRAETGAGWAVTQLDVLVGRVGFRSITLREGHAELAYWTVRAARGRNIAPRAVRAVSTWMFQSVGLHRIELCHSALNPVSWYFPALETVPAAVVDHVRRDLGLAAQTTARYTSARTAERHRDLVRRRFGVVLDPAGARKVAADAIREAAYARNHPPT